MRVAPVERPIASSAYSFVRFAGGAVAPWLAGKLAEWVAPDTPFFVGAAAVRRRARRAGRRPRATSPRRRRSRSRRATPVAPVLVAVDGSSRGIDGHRRRGQARRRARRGRSRSLHVHETDVVGEEAVDRESREMAGAVLALRLGAAARGGRAARAARSCTPSATARTPCARCCPAIEEVGAQAVVVGRRGQVAERANVPVVVVPA